ncbi:hypothetical protein BDR07DRAFT_850949 [Suillus spraguei]|nr:hypothetical protein BDR07DRAFT_850949 [Suillus spraguei]
MGLIGQIPEKAILSSTYAHSDDIEGDAKLLSVIIYILTTAWEALTVSCTLDCCKKFRDLRRFRSSGGPVILNVFTYLLQRASFLAIACLQLGRNSPHILVCHSVTDIACDSCSPFL